jgi:hypothetical protein
MSPIESGLSVMDSLTASLKPLGGPLRIDAFIRLMARERAKKAAQDRALREAAMKAEVERQAAQKEKAKEKGKLPAQPEVTDEVQAFLKRDQGETAGGDEVSDFMEYIGDAGFDPESLPE